jgi:hypothetical protein
MKQLFYLLGIISLALLYYADNLTDQVRVVLMFKLGIKDFAMIQTGLGSTAAALLLIGFRIPTKVSQTSVYAPTMNLVSQVKALTDNQSLVDRIDRALNLNTAIAHHPWLAQNWFNCSDLEKTIWVEQRRESLMKLLPNSNTGVSLLNALIEADKIYIRSGAA